MTLMLQRTGFTIASLCSYIQNLGFHIKDNIILIQGTPKVAYRNYKALFAWIPFNLQWSHDQELTGTERCQEALHKLKKKYDIVVNIQGDEPLIDPDVIDGVTKALQVRFFCLG